MLSPRYIYEMDKSLCASIADLSSRLPLSTAFFFGKSTGRGAAFSFTVPEGTEELENVQKVVVGILLTAELGSGSSNWDNLRSHEAEKGRKFTKMIGRSESEQGQERTAHF